MQGSTNTKEKTIINWQNKAVIATILIFVVSAFLSRVVFHSTMRYAALLTILPMLYIAISSMKNRISIFRLKGQKEYARGQQAFLFGAILLLVELTAFLFLLTPFSDPYVNF